MNEVIDTPVKVKPDVDPATLPSLVSRIKALFIDFLFMLFVFALASTLIDAVGPVPDFVRGFIIIFMVYLYDPLLTSLTGSTVGQRIMGLKVRRNQNPDRKISIGQAFLRFFVKGLLGWLSFLTVTGNERKRAIHDLASGSIVLVSR